MTESRHQDARILIIEDRLYKDVSDALFEGAKIILDENGVGYQRISVPGILEMPVTVRYAVRAMQVHAVDVRYAGYLTLGTLLRSDLDNDHFNLVAGEVIRSLQNLVLESSLAHGNGLVLTDNHTRAMELADPARGNYGGWAAGTCLRMLDVKREMGL